MCFRIIVGLAGLMFAAYGSAQDEPSTKHLKTVRLADFGDLGRSTLANPSKHSIHICSEHFPSQNKAGRQVDLAINEINRIEGCAVELVPVRKGVQHFDAFDLFPLKPSFSIFDYVDIDKPMPKKFGLPNDLTFAMRTCRFDRDAKRKVRHFTIIAHSKKYDHFGNPKSKDTPMKRGVLHEFAHAMGMNHAKQWSPENRHLISTMQGHLRYLSALDVGYMRHFYPDPSGKKHCNFVVSSICRFDGKKSIFDKVNPSRFYLDEQGKLRDIATGAAPQFQVAWFNTGNKDAPEIAATNRLYLRHPRSGKEVPLHEWKIASMPHLAQDQWRGTVDTSFKDDVAKVVGTWLLTFEVNSQNTWDELTREDNRIAYPVVITSKDSS